MSATNVRQKEEVGQVLGVLPGEEDGLFKEAVYLQVVVGAGKAFGDGRRNLVAANPLGQPAGVDGVGRQCVRDDKVLKIFYTLIINYHKKNF